MDNPQIPPDGSLSLRILEGIRKAVAKAIAEHERAGRGKEVRAAQSKPKKKK